MKSSVLKAALVVTLLMGTQAFANDCGPCEPVCDPCGVTDGSKSCDLFAGLRNLVAQRTACADVECDPCEGVVAYSPCDEVACDPCNNCGDLGCDTDCFAQFSLGKRLKGLFAQRDCNIGPCDVADADCYPCDDLGNSCDDNGCRRTFSLRKFFKGFSLAGRCDIGCDDPCGAACDLGDCGLGDCDPCGNICDDLGNCNPCDDVNCNSCKFKAGSLLDKPRRGLKKLFEGLSFGGCDIGCNPCDAVNPCDNLCNSAPAASMLPEAAQ